MNEYDTCPALKAWEEGLLSHGEALSYLAKMTNTILANLMVTEAISGEQRFKDAGVIR